MKTCSKCAVEKPISEYWRRGDSLHPSCKACAGEYQRQWKREHPEAQRSYKRKWQETHPEEHLAAKRRRHAAAKERISERMKAVRAADPERFAEYNRVNRAKRVVNGKERERRLMVDYGLTVEEYDALMAKQGERCPICDRSLVDGRVKPVVDHCHDSGKVRGLLCVGCNMHLGWFESRQKTARAYLKGC